MNQTILLFLTIILLHNIVQFTTYWKRLIPRADWLCRTYLAVSIILMLGGSAGVAFEAFKSAPVILIIGIVIFLSTIHRQSIRGVRLVSHGGRRSEDHALDR